MTNIYIVIDKAYSEGNVLHKRVFTTLEEANECIELQLGFYPFYQREVARTTRFNLLTRPMFDNKII